MPTRIFFFACMQVRLYSEKYLLPISIFYIYANYTLMSIAPRMNIASNNILEFYQNAVYLYYHVKFGSSTL